MRNYVLGFALNNSLKEVILIRKNRPQWQSGRLNGVGGKVEFGESSEQAMIREFEEEAGLYVPLWNNFVQINGQDFGTEYRIECFYSVLESDLFYNSKSVTDEIVSLYSVDSIQSMPSYEYIPNILWLTKMAISQEISDNKIKHVFYD